MDETRAGCQEEGQIARPPQLAALFSIALCGLHHRRRAPTVNETYTIPKPEVRAPNESGPLKKPPLGCSDGSLHQMDHTRREPAPSSWI
jgi:hypothetical protein